jgi:hypothetical protein
MDFFDQKNYFLLLTDADRNTINNFLSKFKKESSKREIVKNVWVLALVTNKYISVNEVIGLFNDSYNGKCMVIRMDSGIDAGWIIDKDDSEYIKNII